MNHATLINLKSRLKNGESPVSIAEDLGLTTTTIGKSVAIVDDDIVLSSIPLIQTGLTKNEAGAQFIYDLNTIDWKVVWASQLAYVYDLGDVMTVSINGHYYVPENASKVAKA